MKKLLLGLILLIPLLALGQVAELKHDASYYNYNWYGNHNFYGDSVYIYMSYIDTLIIQKYAIPDAHLGADLGTFGTAFDSLVIDDIVIYTRAVPNDSSGANLGSASLPFGVIYNDISVISGHIRPDGNGEQRVGTSAYAFATMWSLGYYFGTQADGDSIGFHLSDSNLVFANIDTLLDIGAIETNIALVNVRIVPVSDDSVDIGSDANKFRYIYADSLIGNYFGGVGADFEIGEADYDITFNADSLKGIAYLTAAEATITDTFSVLRIAYIDTADIDTAHIDDLDVDVLTADSVDISELTLDTLTIGDAEMTWETADANANMLHIKLPTGGATDVPVIGLIPAIAEGKDLGGMATPMAFDGTTQIVFFIMDADTDAIMYNSFASDDVGLAFAGKGNLSSVNLGSPLNISQFNFPEATTDQIYVLLNYPMNLAATDSGSIIIQLDGVNAVEYTARGDGSNGIDSVWYRLNDPDGTAFAEFFSDGTNKVTTIGGNIVMSGNVAGATYGSDASISDAELLTWDNGAVTEIIVGGGAGSAPVWGTDIPTAVTIGAAYIYRAGGTDVPDGDVADNITITNISQVGDITASASEINTPLDGASVTLTEFQELETIGATTISANQWATLGGIAETLTSAELDILDGVTGVTAAELSYIGDVTGLIQAQIDGKQPLEATLTDIADGTIAENLVNTTNPWADDEVADDITCSSYLPLAGGTLAGNLTFGDPGTSANSYSLYMIADNATATQTAEVKVVYGADPYLQILVPNDAGTATALLDLHDQRIVIGSQGTGIDYDIFFNGETNQGSITYMEDEDRFDFDAILTQTYLVLTEQASLPGTPIEGMLVKTTNDSVLCYINGAWLNVITGARATP